MANNYIETSTLLPVYPQHIKRVIEDLDNEESDLYLYITENMPGELLSFEFESGDRGIWVYSEEYANVEQIANLAQYLIKETMMDSPFQFSWAETCSKPRLDNFGGGAAIIDADDMAWTSSYVIGSANAVEQAELALKIKERHA